VFVNALRLLSALTLVACSGGAGGVLRVDGPVSGALPIGNGGTAAATAASGFANLSPLTTKGDLLGFGTANTRIGVGSNGQMLIASSANPEGISWSYDRTGIPTADEACVGCVGEVLTLNVPSASAVPLSASNTACNLGAATCPSTGGAQSLTLTPGDWSCTGHVNFITGGTGATASRFVAAVTTTSGSVTGIGALGNPDGGGSRSEFNWASSTIGNGVGPSLVIPPFQVLVSSNTPYYLTALATYSAGAISICGWMQCRRMR
jgi:hypothetical protein